MDALRPENVWLVGLVIVAVTGLSLALDRAKSSFPERVRLRSRKSSNGTPPPSIAPEGKKTTDTTSPSTYILPPQRRHALAILKNEAIPFAEINEKEVGEQALPMEMDYRTCPDKRYTPTGFSVEEIKALGQFPDYAELSGVPLPQPYHEFNIDRALPRPYRPFRWSYHQTMCASREDQCRNPLWKRTDC
jgi:hypothetical protein